MTMLHYTFFFLLIFSFRLNAQLYQEQRSQHRFAQTYAGVNALYTPSSGAIPWTGGQAAFPHMVAPRLTLGGLHFWGHVDFQMNFPLVTLANKQLDAQHNFRYNTGADLTARVYPWAVRYGAVRPYVGLGVNFISFVLESEQLGKRSDLYPDLLAVGGFSWAFQHWQINAEVNWMPFHQKTFYINHQQTATLSLPPLGFSLGLVRYFDVTLREEKGMQAGSHQALAEELEAAQQLSSLSIGVGASTALFVAAPEFATSPRRSLPRHRTNIHLDLSLGYLLHRPNMHLGVSYRGYRSDVESYGLEHVIQRQSLAVEGYKFLLNYKGFVPFVGISLGLERWLMAEFQDDIQIGATQETLMFSPGIILGWDILASPLETWVLRTNLRYYPFQTITSIEGNDSRVDQLEFNFIQVVLYPQRMVHIPKARKAAQAAGAIF